MNKRPTYELADVLHLFGEQLLAGGKLHAFQKKTLSDVLHCRTIALGGHLDACSSCGHIRISYNSCRNRHCPKCQALEREAWIIARQQDLLPVTYFHVVFTLPEQINALALHNPRFVYNCLFDAAWQTLRTFAQDHKWLGAQMGATMVLHTWGQNLSLHPHLHCVVPAGGLSKRGHWVAAKALHNGKFLFPVKAMSAVFRAIFLRQLLPALENGLLVLPSQHAAPALMGQYRSWRNHLFKKAWVVYAKRPFGGPQQVIEYLGRYTHKTAISNHRLLQVNAQGVTFSYKDYRQQGLTKHMTLDGATFLQRWCLHIVPPAFRRMRHYGILANANKKRALEACRKSLGVQPLLPLSKADIRLMARAKLLKGAPPDQCPACKSGKLLRLGIIPPQARAPPANQMPFWIPLEV